VTNSERLTIALDIRYPQSYLALHPAIRFAKSMDIEVDWLPLPAVTLKPPVAPEAEDDRGTRHRRHRSNAIAREIEIYAKAQGIVLREFYRDADADALNLAWLWMRDRDEAQLEPFLVEIFRAYWALDIDASSLTRTAACVESFGADATGFLDWASKEGPAHAARIIDELHERGVFAVPSYLVGDEIFLGRQHLPMIRWILEGRTGPVPI
jgi:2-hydroxychromene-2-carboxylate isomerase